MIGMVSKAGTLPAKLAGWLRTTFLRPPSTTLLSRPASRDNRPV